MALIVEDGTGVENANSYATREFVDTYHSDRGNSEWAGTHTEKEQNLVKVTDYIEIRFGHRFYGIKEFDVNELSFPRLYLYDRSGNLVTGIPLKLQQAVAEYALRAQTSDLLPDPPDLEMVLRKKEAVGPILEETTYRDFVIQNIKPYPAADRLLREYMSSGYRTQR